MICRNDSTLFFVFRFIFCLVRQCEVACLTFVKVFVVRHAAVVDAFGRDLDDAVSDGLYELMVVRYEEHRAAEVFETVVERGDGFEVEMVRRFVEDEDVGAREHHFGEHTAYTFAAREDFGSLERLFAREEHTAEEAANERFVGVGRELTEPVDERELDVVEVLVVVAREVCLRRGDAPLIRACFGLYLTHDDVKEGAFCEAVRADERDLVAFFDAEADVVEEFFACDGMRDAFYREELVACFTASSNISL